MIRADFSAYSTYTVDSLYQWDLNRVLSIPGLNLTEAPEVHFSNANTDRAIVRQSTLASHVVSVAIPNSLLQDPLTIKAHIGIYEGSAFKVVELVEIPVIPRKRPLDYQIEDTDEEVYSFKRLENMLGNRATNARVDNIVANANSTEGNSELVDVRYGADGVTYASAGESVRKQFKKVSSVHYDRLNDVLKNSMALLYEDVTDLEFSPGWFNYMEDVVKDTDNHNHRHTTLQVKAGDVFKLSGVTAWHAKLYILENDAGEFVQICDEGQAAQITHTDEVVVINEDGTLILNDFGAVLVVKKATTAEPTERRDNVLWGKTLVACGDSFTAGDFTGYTDEQGHSGTSSTVIYDAVRACYKTYPWWIAERNNMELVNEARCGSTMALTKNYLNDPSAYPITASNPFSYERYKNLPDNIDYLTIMFGLNDMVACDLGTIDDTKNETFYGAFNVVLRYLIEKYPYTKIGLIVSNSYLSEEFRTAIKEVGVKWGVPCLDLMDDPGVPMTLSRTGACSEAVSLRKAQFEVSSSNGHPNIKAHECQSTYIEHFLRSL